MFEDRRNQVNGRPPAYAKNGLVKKPAPVKGWDRSHPLDPLPAVSPYESRNQKQTGPQPIRSRVRGVSLERSAVNNVYSPDNGSDGIRRSRSQFLTEDSTEHGSNDPRSEQIGLPEGHNTSHSSSLKPKSMTSLLDDNQNALSASNNVLRVNPRLGYPRQPSMSRQPFR